MVIAPQPDIRPAPRSRAARWWGRLASRVVNIRSDYPMVALDILAIAGAFTAMLVLRFDARVPHGYWQPMRIFIPTTCAVFFVSNLSFGLYGKLWRHASVYEAQRLLMSGITSGITLLVLEQFDRRMPYSVLFSGTLVSTLLMALVRFQSRLFSFHRVADQPGMRVVVIGAGVRGARLVGDMLHNPKAGYQPVAVLDDDPTLHGRSFLGVDVLGGVAQLPAIANRSGAHLAVLALDEQGAEVAGRAMAAAATAGITLKVAPPLDQPTGASLRELRELRIEDLLGREQAAIDMGAVRSMLGGRCVLITGAGGSIGAEIARQVAACEPLKLVLLDHDETHLYDVAETLDGTTVQVLADIRDRARMYKEFETHRPSVVFHAAAHKHVPLLEAHPDEAVGTNVLGTSNVLDAARAVGAERFVLISTDKAVYPSSVMGASKRVCEQLVVARAPRAGGYCAVRFGNVLGSRGSVVPTFQRQIAAGGPVTVTDERMTRFFMSIHEAVQLVLQAAALADPTARAEIFMLDMGEQVSIYELAERMIRLAGQEPGTDVEIRLTGMRPGEKLHEELTSGDEIRTATSHVSIMRVLTPPLDTDRLEQGVLRLEHFAGELNGTRCGELLLAMATLGRPAAYRAGH